MTFEWDEDKNSENIRTHKVSFEKAQDIGVKGKNSMKNIYSDPEKSVMEALDSAVLVTDFLPSPAKLIRKSTKEKITISIDSDCINFFKTEAKKNHTKYQTMMNEVLSQYAKHYAVN
ncbi:BrnA antitoxin family protein [Treponema sp.]|uniref:BrnA antitoxin family protein n=1 Tax=Treponema sp. TaxID=166 RepID=UPI003FA3405E